MHVTDTNELVNELSISKLTLTVFFTVQGFFFHFLAYDCLAPAPPHDPS